MARLVVALLLSLALAASLASRASAQLSPGERITFRDTLEKGLKARTDRDRQYLGRVVALVDQKTLSRDLVLTVFEKARQKNARVPLVPFRFILATLAGEKGVQIPY